MQLFGKTITLIPSPAAETTQLEARMDKYGDFGVIPFVDPFMASAIEGSMYVARPAPAAGGTGIALGIQTTFSDTANIAVCLQNGGATKTIIPVYIKGRCTAAGANSTTAEVGIEVDATNRYSASGTALSGLPTNPSASSPATGGVVHVGAVTATAAGAGRNWIWSEVIREAATPMWIIDDQVIFAFGAFGQGVGFTGSPAGSGAATNGPVGGTATRAAGANRSTFGVPACALPPTATLLLHMINVANSATPPSFEWELCWIER